MQLELRTTTKDNMKRNTDALARELHGLPTGTLYLKRFGNYTSFVRYLGQGETETINRNKDLVYQLARKQYLSLYLPVLSGGSRSELDQLLERYQQAKLDIARITLTPAQYEWIHGNYKSNPYRPEEKKYASNSGVLTRSKSEREITNQYEWLGIPTRYEALLKVDLSSLIPILEKKTASFRGGKSLFHYSNGLCTWNVPPELSWMNMRGSIWRGMDPYTFTTEIYPDFTTLTCDNATIIHEHEGVASDPFYRCTASDRIFVLRETGTVKMENLITTFEHDVADTRYLRNMFATRILPRI